MRALEARSLAGAMAAFVVTLTLSAAPAQADVSYTVDSTTDAVQAGSGTVCGEPCTLRGAIMAADNATSGNVTISVPLGTYTLTIAPAVADGAASGDLNITYAAGTVSIVGAGSSSTIVDANGLDRAYNTASGTTVSLSGMTIENGRPGASLAPPPARRHDGLATCPAPSPTLAPGGGILDQGTLTLSGDVLTDNVARGNGGGVEDGGNGVLTVADTAFADNMACKSTSLVSPQAIGDGGGIDEDGGQNVVIDTSSFSGNSASDSCGGVCDDSQTSGSAITGNSAVSQQGGGIGDDSGGGGTLSLFGDFISGNSSGNGGGGVGASDTLSIVNSTITANSTTSTNVGGGGISQTGKPTTISFSTITNNSDAAASPEGDGANIQSIDGGGPINIDDSIVAGGVGPRGTPDNCNANSSLQGNIVSVGNNLFDDTSDLGAQCAAIPSDIVNANPGLGPPANNGGPTETQALLPGSPAIDAASDARCGETTNSSDTQVDQRGITRPQGAHCDIGAFEVQGSEGGGGGGGGGGSFGQATTETQVSCNPNPSQVGQQVTCTATVSPSPNGGTVEFTDPGVTIPGCGAVPVDPATGGATCTTTFDTAGSFQIQAIYAGDGFYAGSASPIPIQIVQPATPGPNPPTSTSTRLSASAGPAVTGQVVLYTAVVSPAHAGGTVEFFQDGHPIAGCGAVPVDAATGHAGCRTIYKRASTHQITATYSGNASFTRSHSTALTERVVLSAKLLGQPRVKHGKVSVEIACAAHSGGCPITVRLAGAGLQLGKASRTIPAGSTRKITVALKTDRHGLVITLAVLITIGGQQSTVATSTLTL